MGRVNELQAMRQDLTLHEKVELYKLLRDELEDISREIFTGHDDGNERQY